MSRGIDWPKHARYCRSVAAVVMIGLSADWMLTDRNPAWAWPCYVVCLASGLVGFLVPEKEVPR